MNILEDKVKTAIDHAGMSQAEVARAMGQTPQNLNKKITRGTLTMEELEQIGQIVGATWVARFEFPDGRMV